MILGIFGCGTMGQAILTGLIDTGTIKPSECYCSVASDESAQELRDKYGPELNVGTGDDGNTAVAQNASVLLLCTKPQLAKSIFDNDIVRAAMHEKLLISICAGVRIWQIKEWLPNTAVIRAMPNTPCKIRQGMTVLCTAQSTSRVSPEHKEEAKKIFKPLGRCRFLEEKHMDAVTGLSGSGPAFSCVVLEALADGGVMMGLPREIALELSAQALAGAAHMVLETGQHPSVIKDDVTTPAGCTIAGLLSMEDGKIRSTLARAVQVASVVAGKLGGVDDKK